MPKTLHTTQKTKKGKKSKKSTKNRTTPNGKPPKETGGFPDLLAIRKLTVDGETSYIAGPADFSDITDDAVVALFRRRRVVNVEVSRKIKRTPKA